MFAGLLSISASATEWPNIRFSVIYENFAWGESRRGILIDDAGHVYSFLVSEKTFVNRVCSTNIITAYQETGWGVPTYRVRRETLRVDRTGAMIDLAIQAIRSDPQLAKRRRADSGLVCYFFYEEVENFGWEKRHLISVRGDYRVEPGEQTGESVSSWLDEIFEKIDWTESRQFEKPLLFE